MRRTGGSGTLVYSTEGGRHCPGCARPVAQCQCAKTKPARKPAQATAAPAMPRDGIVRIQRESKGRGGKSVTVVYGLELPPDALKALAGELKQRCGVGGAVKDGRIELQGDQRDAAEALLLARGHKVKRAGG